LGSEDHRFGSITPCCNLKARPLLILFQVRCGENLEFRNMDVRTFSYDVIAVLTNRDVAQPAVQNGNVAFADGNLFFNRSGMTVSQTAKIIAEILHGVSFGEKSEGIHWRWSEARMLREI
jgi:hypothetical protein